MPKFYGQNKKRINPRYFLNETTDITRMDTLQDSGELESALVSISLNDLLDIVEPYLEDDERQRISQTRQEDLQAVVIDIVKLMPEAEGEEIYDLVVAYGSKIREDQDIQVGDDVTYEGEVYQVKDIEGGKVDLERYVKDSAGGHSQSEYGVPVSSVEPA